MKLAACQTSGSDGATWPMSVEDGAGDGVDTIDNGDISASPCGDGACAQGEDVDSCPMDCHDALAATLRCVDRECEGAWGKCAVRAPCAAAIKCMAGCPDDGCTKGCEATAGDDKPALNAVLGCTICRDGA